MIRILHDTRFNFIRWWRWTTGLTAAFILAGLVTFGITGEIRYSIEFTGGTLMQVEFREPVRTDDIRSALAAGNIHGAEIAQFGSPREFTIRAPSMGEGGLEESTRIIENALAQRFATSPGFTVARTEAVSAKVGDELQRGAAIAMLLGSLITLVYLAIRFEWRFGVAAVITSLHDILVTFSFIKLMDLEISLMIIAGILTLLGYSMNDTIIIFDRVRENLRRNRKEPLYDLLNRSINETLPRSVLTHTTTIAASMALLFVAGEVLRPFAWVMTFGVVAATFSSIYVAAPVLLWIETKFQRKSEGHSGTAPKPTTGPRRRKPEPETVGAR
jgi:preprotein translocase subunit SecF